MRMTEEQYQNLPLNQKNEGLQRLLSRSDAKVAEILKNSNTGEIRAICNDGCIPIFECEIATVPPSVNHYWLSNGKKRYLSDSLVKCGLCIDDEQFDELIVKRGNVIKGGLIKLKVCTI